MTDTMKALAKTKPGVGLELIDAPIPVAGDEDVLIKVHKAAVCGTDIHIWNWDEWSQKNVPVPMITGHEFSARSSPSARTWTVASRWPARLSRGHVIDLNSEAARAGHFHLDRRQGIASTAGRLRRVCGGACLQRDRAARRRAR